MNPPSTIAPLRQVRISTRQHGRGFTDANLLDQLGSLDPFINLSLFHMAQPYFPLHPHAGISVMTYLFEDSAGAFVNRDSRGDHSRIEPGALHWTQAGRGVQHEEVPEVAGQDCHGLQMWVNHCAADRLLEPHAYHVGAADVPQARPAAGTRVRVLVGEDRGVKAAFQPPTPITLLDVHLSPGADLAQLVPPGELTVFAYVVRGNGLLRTAEYETRLQAFDAVRFLLPGPVQFAADDAGLEFLWGVGKPLHEPLVFGGPFVMNTAEQIREAQLRYQGGEMGTLQPSF